MHFYSDDRSVSSTVTLFFGSKQQPEPVSGRSSSSPSQTASSSSAAETNWVAAADIEKEKEVFCKVDDSDNDTHLSLEKCFIPKFTFDLTFVETIELGRERFKKR